MQSEADETKSSVDDLPRIVVAPPGPLSRAMAARLAAVESPVFDARRQTRAEESGSDQTPIVYAEGHGSIVVDVDGNRYVDLVAGFGALLLGHRPSRVLRAIDAQKDRLWLALGDVYGSDVKLDLCERLAALLPEPGARVMLGSSGADALTAALKTAMLATGRAGVLAFEGSYHGLSHGPLAACGLSEAFRAPFAAQLGAHVVFAPYPASDAELEACKLHVNAAIRDHAIGAVLVEPVLGRGGCVVPPAEFLPFLRSACDASGALLVVDEVWTGLGRAGAMLSSVAAGVLPDVVCLGKGLGSGLPISACIGRAEAMQEWGAHGGSAIHTATHFGAPLVSAAALATLDVLRDDALGARATRVGDAWRAALVAALGDGAASPEVRGQGLMVGIVVPTSARALALSRALLSRGYLVLTGGRRGNTLTLSPPLTIAEAQLAAFTSALAAVVGEKLA